MDLFRCAVAPHFNGAAATGNNLYSVGTIVNPQSAVASLRLNTFGGYGPRTVEVEVINV